MSFIHKIRSSLVIGIAVLGAAGTTAGVAFHQAKNLTQWKVSPAFPGASLTRIPSRNETDYFDGMANCAQIVLRRHNDTSVPALNHREDGFVTNLRDQTDVRKYGDDIYGTASKDGLISNYIQIDRSRNTVEVGANRYVLQGSGDNEFTASAFTGYKWTNASDLRLKQAYSLEDTTGLSPQAREIVDSTKQAQKLGGDFSECVLNRPSQAGMFRRVVNFFVNPAINPTG
jgi:hypothetical protein